MLHGAAAHLRAVRAGEQVSSLLACCMFWTVVLCSPLFGGGEARGAPVESFKAFFGFIGNYHASRDMGGMNTSDTLRPAATAPLLDPKTSRRTRYTV